VQSAARAIRSGAAGALSNGLTAINIGSCWCCHTSRIEIIGSVTMSVAQLSMDQDAPAKPGLPWHWLIFLPVAASVVAGLTTLAIAIRHGDKPLPETVTRTGPVLYGEHVGVSKARELGISGAARIDAASNGIIVELLGRDLPPTLMLRLWHPTMADHDQLVLLTRGDDGSYRGAWPTSTAGLQPLLSAPEAGWELPGSMSDGSLRFQP
jgi:hypothetical protein